MADVQMFNPPEVWRTDVIAYIPDFRSTWELVYPKEDMNYAEHGLDGFVHDHDSFTDNVNKAIKQWANDDTNGLNFTDSVKERRNVEHYTIPDAEDFIDQTGYIQTTTKLKLTYQKPKNQFGLLQEDQLESVDQFTKQQQLKESNWVVHIQRPLPPTVIFMKSYTVEASCIFENEFDYSEEIHYP